MLRRLFTFLLSVALVAAAGLLVYLNPDESSLRLSRVYDLELPLGILIVGSALAGGLHRLPRQIGLKQAMGMILTGRRVGAAEGQALGFVNEVVPAAELMDAARRGAAQICELSPMSIRASKEAVFKGLDEPSLKDAMAGQMRYPAAAAVLRSEDFKEGPRAFAEKRKPNWQGR